METAECDASVPCEQGRICYDHACREICELPEGCGVGAVCSPCSSDDAEGIANHCFDATVWACLPEGA